MEWDSQGLSDVYCLLHCGMRLSFGILMYFVLSNLFVLNAFFDVLHFVSSGNQISIVHWKWILLLVWSVPHIHQHWECAVLPLQSSRVWCFLLMYQFFAWWWVVTLTYFMQQTPSGEANRFAASPEILHILWNPKVHYRIYKCPSYFPILSHLNTVHTPTSQFLKIHLIIFVQCMPRSPKWTLSLRFPHQPPVYASPLPHICYIPCPSHSSHFDHTSNTGWGI